MAFTDWMKNKLITVDTIDDLIALEYHFYGTTRNIIKKIYNVYKDSGLFDIDEVRIAKTKDCDKNVYFFCADDKYINFDYVFSLIKELMIIDEVNALRARDDYSKKIFNKLLISSTIPNGNLLDYNKKYYYLLTLNPRTYEAFYIKSVEEILNKKITVYNELKYLYDEFIDCIENDYKFRNIIYTTYLDFGIIAFENKIEYDQYNEHLDNIRIATEPLPDDIINFISNLDINDDEEDDEKEEGIVLKGFNNSETLLS